MHVEIIEAIAQARLPREVRDRGKELRPPRIMMLDSGTVRSLASSRSTGILPMGHIFLKSAADAASARSTIWGSNGVSFS